jgi:hemerythrin
MTIEWDYASMTTGLPAIDEQHQEWIRRFNEFDEAVTAGQGTEAIQRTLDFLAKYAETHFENEEAIAAQLHSPIEQLNHTNHDNFRAKLYEIQKWIHWDGASVVEVLSLKIDMENWLVNHICTVDTQLRPHE